MITVLTRTSRRPIYFSHCLKSIRNQTVQPYHIISTDDPEDSYCWGKGNAVIHIPKLDGRETNRYFNNLRQYIPKHSPWVIFLDDDDQFTDLEAVEKIQNRITSDDDLLLWQVNFPHGLVPGEALGAFPRPGNITGIGFCYHMKHWVDWVPMAFGDYYIIAELYSRLKPVWINEVLTGMQTGPGHALRLDRS